MGILRAVHPGDGASDPLEAAEPLPYGAFTTRPVRLRLWLHLGLLGATAVTATCAGALWEGEVAEAESWGRLLDPVFLVRGVPYALLLLLILGAHEMGHYLACRYYGIPATLPFFIPGLPILGTFGAVIRIRGIIPHRRALFDVAAAGPIAGFVVALPVLIAGLLRATPTTDLPTPGGIAIGEPLVSSLAHRFLVGEVPLRVDSVYVAGWVGMLVTSMNLFPVGQLDGGHAAYALSRRAHRTLSRLTVALLFGLVVFQALSLRTMPVYTLWLVVLLFLRDRHPWLADENEPLRAGRLLVAVLLGIMFLLCFIPLPIVFL